jgi:hypothetical protein
MIAYLVQIDAWSGSTAVPLCLASHDDERLCHLNGQVWWPAIATLPKLRYDFFDGGFDAKSITSPTGSLTVGFGSIPNLPALAIHDARVRIWQGNLGDAWGAFTLKFEGRVKEQPEIANGIATVSIGIDDSWLDQPLLATYAGTGGAEGATDLQGAVKPLALGAPRFAPGVLVDAVDNIYQISAYGVIGAVSLAFDRLTRFGAAIGDYASFAALKAASVQRGQWATCLAGGYVRFGAPADGLVSFHANGDSVGGWSRLPGALIQRVATIAGGVGKFSTSDMTALNSARPWNLSLMVTAQTTARELIQRIAASVNAVAFVDWLGVLRVAAIGIGTASVTMAADGSALPPVASVEQIAIAAPFWRLSQGAVPTWQVHSASDIAFNLNAPMGEYDAATVYREGDVVSLSDGSQWLFVSTVPTANSAPADANTDWQRLSNAVVAVTSSGASIEALLDDLTTVVDAKRIVFTQPTAPTAAESQENDWWQQTDGSGNIIATYVRVAGTGRLSIGGNAILLGGSYVMLPWAPVGDQRITNALAAATAASNLADSKAVIFTMYSASDPVPTGTDIGDVLVRAYLSPVQMDYWSGSAWVAAATYGATATQAALLSTTATNFNARNDRLGTTPVAPTIVTDGTAVDHSINTGGSADISFEWVWGGTESDIDGFEILVYASTSSAAYTIGATPAAEQTFFMAAGKRAFILYGAEPTSYYTFAVRAYRMVDPDVAATGIIQSAWVKPSAGGENPYRPASSVAFAGDVTGTVSGAAASTVASGAAAANNGLNGDGSLKDGKASTQSLVAGSVISITIASNSGSSAAFTTIHELAYVTVGSLPSGVTGIKIAAFGQVKYTGGPTPGYPMLRIYRVPAANAASYLASASGTNRNPSSSGGSVTGKNATLANWSNVDMAAALQHSTTSPAAGDLYVLAIDVSTYPPAAGAWSYNWSGEISIDIVKR